MTRQELIEAVKVEAANLKKYATKEELDNLDFNTFNPSSSNLCIYGQMTGRCWSRRSHELIINSTKIGFPMLSYGDIDVGIGSVYDRNFSPIEKYIATNNDTDFQVIQNKKLISYLKGETDDLNLE